MKLIVTLVCSATSLVLLVVAAGVLKNVFIAEPDGSRLAFLLLGLMILSLAALPAIALWIFLRPTQDRREGRSGDG